jgi:hypothetical protein
MLKMLKMIKKMTKKIKNVKNVFDRMLGGSLKRGLCSTV